MTRLAETPVAGLSRLRFFRQRAGLVDTGLVASRVMSLRADPKLTKTGSCEMSCIRRVVLPLFLALFVVGLPAVASACPMCNQSIQEDKSLPFAYQASILFMLAIPFSLAGGLGGLIWYKFRQHEQATQAAYALQGLQPIPVNAHRDNRGMRV